MSLNTNESIDIISLDNGDCVIDVVLDFAKDFNIVDRDILLQKIGVLW